MSAALAAKPRNALLHHAARRQERPEFALDEQRQAAPSLASTAAPRKASRWSAMTWWSTVHGVTGPVDRALEGHGPPGGVKARQCWESDTPNRVGTTAAGPLPAVSLRSGTVGEGGLVPFDHVV